MEKRYVLVVLWLLYTTLCSSEIFSGFSAMDLHSCRKRQEYLNSMSANQVFHLDPLYNGWCQKLSISQLVYEELYQSPYDAGHMDLAATISHVVKKLSGALDDAHQWLTAKEIQHLPSTTLRPFNHSINATARLPLRKVKDKPKSTLNLPEVVASAWTSYQSMLNLEDRSLMSQWIYCRSPRIPLKSQQPSWWFFTFEDCENPDEMVEVNANKGQRSTRKSKSILQPWKQIAYRIELLNSDEKNPFRRHFSAENFGKLETDVIFFLLLTIIFSMASILVYRLYKMHLIHPMVLIWFGSIAFRFMAQLFQLIVDIHLARTGWYNLGGASIAQLIYGFSVSIFFSGLALLSSGYTTVHRRASMEIRMAFLSILGVYTVLCMGSYLFMELTHFQSGIFSRYHSSPGLILVGLQITAYTLFLSNCIFTYLKWSGKRIFFVRLALISTLWFLNIPLWTFILTNHAHEWFTQNFIRVMDEVVHLAGFLILLIILRPEKTNLIFPFYQDNDEIDQSQLATKDSTSTIKPAKSAQQIVSTSKMYPSLSSNKKFNLVGKPGDLPAPGSGLSKIVTGTSVQTEQTKHH